MKIFPLSDLILLPLAPTITRAIADYLQLITCSPDINSLQKGCVDVVSESARDWSWQQFQRSIRQVPTLQYQYVSTIAHQLAAKSARTAVEICQQLQTIPTPRIELDFHLHCHCWYNPAGYIYFQLTSESILTWLNYIHDLPLVGLVARLQTTNESILQGRGCANDLAIYAHARCCSLLKLAATEQLTTISANWQISQPNWLLDVESSENRLTAESRHIFDHIAEQQLIHTFMAVLDGIYGDNWQLESSRLDSIGQIAPGASNGHKKSPNLTKLTIDLAQSWLEFNRHCQIFGDLSRQSPRRAIARCGLTAIARRYLQVLLECHLGVVAAVEL